MASGRIFQPGSLRGYLRGSFRQHLIRHQVHSPGGGDGQALSLIERFQGRGKHPQDRGGMAHSLAIRRHASVALSTCRDNHTVLQP